MVKGNGTKFVSPQRSSDQEVFSSKKILGNSELFMRTLNVFPEIVLVLDGNRQIVYCNQQALKFLGLSCVDDAIGRRPGEAFQCIHSDEEETGCGTSEFCRECGAVKSILEAQKGKGNSQECHMTVKTAEGEESSFDLRVWGVPLEIDGNKFIVFTIRDIGDEKRRDVLERIFFHDILNDVGVLMGYSQNVRDGFLIEGENPGEKMSVYAKRLIDAVNAQRDLVAAERGEFEIKKEKFFVLEFLNDIVDFSRNSHLARNREVILDCKDAEAEVETDRVILYRILTNLIKNALEATEANGKVLVQYSNKEDGRHCFSVHNDSAMEDPAKLQIFQRSFSTKGAGRGIGTYSVKLFTERYLKGKVYFISKEEGGTTFSVVLL